jgi:4,5-DOPA dioxygenase extradiol
MRWPVLFVSHGSPMLAVEPGRAGPTLAAWSRGYGRPAAILAISPHWREPGLVVGTRDIQEAWHDFGGFPPELYRLTYGPPGSAALARRLQSLLSTQGRPVRVDAARPLDHGVWVPLRYLYPDADVPVVPLALHAGFDAHAQYRLGLALRPLRDEGVLILASGSLTHNLRHVQRDHDAPPLPYVAQFQQWCADRLAQRDTAALLDWSAVAPGAAQAHPHDDHLMPLFAGWGAGEGKATRLVDEITYGALAMDAYQFD